MFKSIFEDFKGVFRSGNMLSRIVVVNVVVFIIVNLLFVFDFNSAKDPSSFANYIFRKISIVSDPFDMLKQFWGLITHMFVHKGFGHIFWNMLLLYWFGRIVGDFLNDKRILPLYLLGGIAGAFAFFLFGQIDHSYSQAIGASAAVMCMMMVAATLSPDYIMNLILIGPVKLKYIAFVLLLIDLFGAFGSSNTGGHIGHLGGALFGWYYVHLLRKGTDITEPLQNLIAKISNWGEPKIKKTPRSTFTVYKNTSEQNKSKKSNSTFTEQNELDRILEKITAQGYDKLTAEEKEFLYQASKKK